MNTQIGYVFLFVMAALLSGVFTFNGVMHVLSKEIYAAVYFLIAVLAGFAAIYFLAEAIVREIAHRIAMKTAEKQ